jgi:hypothetical protein
MVVKFEPPSSGITSAVAVIPIKKGRDGSTSITGLALKQISHSVQGDQFSVTLSIDISFEVTNKRAHEDDDGGGDGHPRAMAAFESSLRITGQPWMSSEESPITFGSDGGKVTVQASASLDMTKLKANIFGVCVDAECVPAHPPAEF